MKQRIKLGDVYLDAVVEELPSRVAEITDKPVETGQDISDHIKMVPTIVNLSGTMINDAAAKLNILRDYQKDAELLRYIGRGIFDNMVIQRLDTDHAKDTAQGYHFDIVLKQVSIAKPETFKVKVKAPTKPVQAAKPRVAPKVQPKVKPKTNSGRKQVQTKKVSPKAEKRIKTSIKGNIRHEFQ